MRRAVVLAESEEGFREASAFCRRYLAFYGSAPGYQAIMRELGYADAVEEIRAGYATRDRQRTTNAITDAMVSRICTFGSAAVCQARLREDYAGGVDTIAVSPQASDAAAFRLPRRRSQRLPSNRRRKGRSDHAAVAMRPEIRPDGSVVVAKRDAAGRHESVDA